MSKLKNVNLKVDAKKKDGNLEHVWTYIGYDENNYTHTPEGESLIEKFGKLEDGPYYIRAHHMLCTGNCHGVYKWGSTNMYREDENGKPLYNFEVFDKIIDVYLKYNTKPFVELGFMPKDLIDPKYSSFTDAWGEYNDYQKNTWSAPPKDYDKWYDLIYNIGMHCIEKYGKEEVDTWYWELWNEPDIFYWKGDSDEFCKLYDYTEKALHTALPEAKLGGPATTGPLPGSSSLEYLEKFFVHCKTGNNYAKDEIGTRLDYVTFHVKGGGFPFELDAKKSTPSVKSLVLQVKTGLEAMKKHGYGDLEVILSEADPDGWAAGGRFDNQNMNFRNTEYYASYVASTYYHIELVARSMGIKVKPLAWAFMFVGERCFEGTRTFTTQGIDKAVFNIFKMYAKFGTQRILFESTQSKEVLSYKDDFGTCEEPEISGFATKKEDGSVQVLVFSHHDDWEKEDKFKVSLTIENSGESKDTIVEHYRIDKDYSNAYKKWMELGQPDYPNEVQYDEIKKKDGLVMFEGNQKVELNRDEIVIEFEMPSHGVSFIEIK